MSKKEDIRKIWVDQIRTAMAKAYAVAGNCEDNGTCNFDMCMIEKEKCFTYDETIAIFKECGINACRGSEYSRYYSGYIALPNYFGQAERNTKWAETFRDGLKEQGFKTSMYYQCD